jgi:hypothetical protein
VTMEQPKLALLNTMLHQVVYSNVLRRKTHAGPIITAKATCLCDEIRICDKHTFLEGSNNKLSVRTYVSSDADS